MGVAEKYGKLGPPYQRRPRKTPAVKISLNRNLTLEERVRIIRYYDWFGHYRPAAKYWKKEFQTKPPSLTTFTQILKRFNETGSILRKVKVRKKKTEIENEEEVANFVKEALKQDPNRTMASLAAGADVTVETIVKIRRKYLMPGRTLVDPLIQELKKEVDKLEKYIESKTGAPPPLPKRWAREQSKYAAKKILRKNKAAAKRAASNANPSGNPAVRRRLVKPKPILDVKYSRRFSLEERIRMVHYFGSPMQWTKMVVAWKEEFGTNAPPRSSFIKLNKKFDQTGSVEERKSIKTPIKIHPKAIANYYTETLKRDPLHRVADIASELGISQSYLTMVRRAFGIPTKPFMYNEVKQLRHRIAELKDEILVVDGKKKRRRKRKDGEVRHKEPAPTESLTVAGTSAASVRAKKARFMFPLEFDGLEENPNRVQLLSSSEDDDDSSSSSYDDSDSESSTSTVALDRERTNDNMEDMSEQIEEVDLEAEQPDEEIEDVDLEAEQVDEEIEEVDLEAEQADEVQEVNEDMIESLEIHELSQEDVDEFNQG